MYNACRPVCHTVVALYFRSDFANLEVLHVCHAVDHFLRLLAEWIDRVILLQVGLQRFSIRMRLELMNQLLSCFLAGVILLLNGRMGQSLDPEVYFTATSTFHGHKFPYVCQNGQKDILASKLVVSWSP